MSEVWLSYKAGDPTRSQGFWRTVKDRNHTIAFVPKAELDALRAENAKLREKEAIYRSAFKNLAREVLAAGESEEVTDEDMRKFMDAPSEDFTFGRCEGMDD